MVEYGLYEVCYYDCYLGRLCLLIKFIVDIIVQGGIVNIVLDIVEINLGDRI